MSADTTPIAPARFSAAIKDLPLQTLHLKVLEIRNSITHLLSSNDQLRPFATGSATALSPSTDSNTGPDQDCIDAIRENEVVVERMRERIRLVRAEVEGRGGSWDEFEDKPRDEETAVVNGDTGPVRNGDGERHPAWSDGTFQVGTIGGGEGISPEDRELMRRLEERMRELGGDDGDGGMHL